MSDPRSDPRSDPAPSLLDEVDLDSLAPGDAFEAAGVELEVTGAADVGGRAVLLCDVTLYGADGGAAGDGDDGARGGDGADASSTTSDTGSDAGRCYAARLYVDGGAYYFAGLPAGAAEAVALLFRGAPRVVLL